MEKQNLYGFVTRLPKDQNELTWRTTGHVGTNPEGTYQYEFSDMVGWKQPIFTQLDFEFFSKKTNDYRVEAVAGREARPQRPVREEVKPIAEVSKPADVAVPPKPANLQPTGAQIKQTEPARREPAEPKRMGRPPKSETQVGA